MWLSRSLLVRLANSQVAGAAGQPGPLGAQHALVALQQQLPNWTHRYLGFSGAAAGLGSGGARGFAAPAASGGGGDEGKPAEEQQAGSQPAHSQVQSPQQGGASAPQPQPKQQQPGAAAEAEHQGGADVPKQKPQQEFHFAGSEHPELKKYIEQLKQLKGSSTVQRQEMGGEPTLWQRLVQVTLGSRLQVWISDFLRARIEKEFEAEDFVEGAKDAFFMVHELMGEEDWDTLRTMMSAKLFAAFQDTANAYKSDGLVWRTKLGGEMEAGIRGMGFLSKQQMAEYDAEKAALVPEGVGGATARPAGMFLMLTVQLWAEQNVTISRQEDGQVVAELKDRRPVRWKFATGPLPVDLPVSRLDTEWFLLSI